MARHRHRPRTTPRPSSPRYPAWWHELAFRVALPGQANLAIFYPDPERRLRELQTTPQA